MALVTAALPAPVAALFWLWLIVSMVILVIRLARRRTQSKDVANASPAEPSVVSGSSGSRSLAPARSSPDDNEPFGSTEPEPAAAAPVTPVAPADGRKGFFTATPAVDAVGSRPVGTARPTVAEALSGITMPCGLSPVVDGSVSIPNPFRVAFLTTAADAATVGAGMADELERLGFQLSTAAATELLARKPGFELRVVLYPTPSAARRGLDIIFAIAPDGSVGVELST